MAITMTTVKCPECGANLQIDERRQQAFCTYCGAKIILTNENEYIYRTIDEAGVAQAETDRMIRLRELELEEAQQKHNERIRNLLIILWIVAIVAVVILCLFVWLTSKDDLGGITALDILGFVGGPVIAGGAFLIFKVLPDRELDKKTFKAGGIRITKSIEPITQQNYMTVQSALISAGFTNISCVNMHDVRLGLLQKNGEVESLTVNGERIFSGGRVFMPDASIIITYHGR